MEARRLDCDRAETLRLLYAERIGGYDVAELMRVAKEIAREHGHELPDDAEMWHESGLAVLAWTEE